ncbi:MAG TPA: GTP cyclohydrolase II [Geminicoccaceae bacterium]
MGPDNEAIAASLAKVAHAVADFRRGRFVLIQAESGSALVQAAETVTSESLRTLKRIGNGSTRLALTARRAEALAYPASSALAVTLDLGASPDADQVLGLVDPMADPPASARPALAPEDAPPGSAPSGAVLLSKLAQLLPAAICVPLTERNAELRGAALPRVPVEAIEAYPRLAAESLKPVSEARVPLAAAENTRLIGFRSADGGTEQFAILIGDPAGHQPTLCRLHSECFTGDLLGSLRCDCGPQLERALRRMGDEGHGVVLYLAHEGRGIGLINKLRAYRLQDAGLDTVDANQHLGFESDERNWRAAAVMLGHLGIDRVRLLTNNPLKVEALKREGVEVVERIPHAIAANAHNRDYLLTKERRSGHMLSGAA